ncbi:MAG: Spy/CpxP family protein refolding chaperone [Bryobacteraceae bacterium]|jgi:Spy/CpxP family protein refolding chaperone
MKLRKLCGIMALSALVGGMLLAQGPGLRARRMGMRGRASQELLAGYLGLTDAQKAQAKTIFDNAKAAAQPIRTEIQQARTNLNAAIKAGQPVDAPAAAVGNLFGQLTAIQAKAREQFRAILTPDQLTKLDQFEARVRNRFGAAPTTP